MFLILCVLVVVILISGFIDKYQVKQFKEINKKIAGDPNYLNDPEKRNLCWMLVSQTRFFGIFTVLEARKLRKNLDKYKV